jgi:nitroreductase
MKRVAHASEMIAEMNRLRQVRQYRPDPVPDEVVDQLLEVARWTGSSQNTQPWHFIVIDDREKLYRISRFRDRINWVADAPMAIAIVLDGKNPTGDLYDEGRVTERLMIAARLLGYGSGTAWFGGTSGDPESEAEARELLGIPNDKVTRSIVVIGPAISAVDPRPDRNPPGRRPLSELVSHNRYGQARG